MYALRCLIGAAVGAVLVTQIGCSMAVKEARGASAKVMVIKDATGLESYRTVTLHELSTDLGDLCPHEMLRTLETALKGGFALIEGSGAGGARALLVRAKINYFEKGGGVKAVLGTQARCHVRLELRRNHDDHLVADLLVPAASSAVVRAGYDDLAKSITRSVLKYLNQRGLASPTSENDDDEDTKGAE